MPASGTFVIAGGGLAGAKAAEALRTQGFDGRIVLAAQEGTRPYERPPLSKEYLQGKAGRDTIFVHPPDWYDANGVELLLGTAVTGIDRGRREVTLSGGRRLAYGRLLLATGSEPRRLPLPGADADGVLYLRKVGDSDRIRDTFTTASRVLIIGAGWIGLEVAAAARTAGVDVTVLEAAELPLLQVLGPQVAPVFAGLHREHGVDLRLGVRVGEITVSGGKATGARLADGTRIGADAVIVGIGAAPNTGLAEAAGLDVRDGVVTGASLRTSDPAIYAAGDIASAFHPLLGRHIRVEHWASALHQPQTAAAAMLGRDASYDRVPYFYTDQYDLGMEYAGYAAVGLAVRGYLPFASTFAAFLSRGYDFLRMAGVSCANIKLCGSHAGTEIGADGPSQMALEDLAAMRAIHGSTVLYPADATAAAALTAQMAGTPGMVYLRTTRGAWPVLYQSGEAFPVGGSKVLRATGGDDVTLIGAGVTVHQCLGAAGELAADGITARVIDLYSVKPVDQATLADAAAAAGGRLVIAEDHYPQGGLGAAVLEALAGAPAPAPGEPLRARQCAVSGLPGSGTPGELMEAAGISASRIAAAARELLKEGGSQ